MKKMFYTLFIAPALFVSCSSEQKNTTGKKIYSSEEIIVESKKANDFFDRVFDAEIDRDPMQQSLFSIKKDYGKS